MKAEDYSERKLEIDGWEINLTTYRLGTTYHSKVDNVSPGASLARTRAETKEEAETKALDRARQLLGRTRRHTI